MTWSVDHVIFPKRLFPFDERFFHGVHSYLPGKCPREVMIYLSNVF
jgi:hypothetical protein